MLRSLTKKIKGVQKEAAKEESESPSAKKAKVECSNCKVLAAQVVAAEKLQAAAEKMQALQEANNHHLKEDLKAEKEKLETLRKEKERLQQAITKARESAKLDKKRGR